MIRPVALAAVFAAALVSCSEEREVSVVFGRSTDGLNGFLCHEDANPDRFLYERVFDRTPPAASLVFDFLDMGGVPGCRSSQIQAWCKDHSCKPIFRSCIDLALPADPVEARRVFADTLLALRGTVITPDAVDDPVMVRAVGIARPCTEVPELSDGNIEFACDTIVGCAYSCPVTFDQLDEDLVLDLDVFESQCETTVDVCASSSGEFSAPSCTR